MDVADGGGGSGVRCRLWDENLKTGRSEGRFEPHTEES